MSTVEVTALRVELSPGTDVVDGISFAIKSGELLGLVGESGSGKTTVATALLGHSRRGARIAGGTVVVNGEDVLGLDSHRLRDLRGRLVAYVPQDPATALNPALRIGRQLAETIDAHEPSVNRAAARERTRAALDEVRLPSGDEFLSRFPHQLSGGQQQRVCIAMAFLLRPRLVVLDEPTTGLDVTTQAHILATTRELCDRHRVAALYVTHDLAVVANVASRILVMYAGRIVESGPAVDVFAQPAHPYTAKLLAAIPDVATGRRLVTIPGAAPAPGERPTGCSFAPRCERRSAACTAGEPPPVKRGGGAVRCLHPVTRSAQADQPVKAESPLGEEVLLYVTGLSARHGSQSVLERVDFDLHRGECLALVGESGSGKTTLARCLVGLHRDWDGTAELDGKELQREARNRPSAIRRDIQYVFQSPYNALNPRRSVGDSLAVPVTLFAGGNQREARKAVGVALERVSLPASTAQRFPDQLSGGECQRVAIARALLCGPRLMVCDEITSALDASVQASILNLLKSLQATEGLAMLFVTHDVALVRTLAHRLLVLRQGRIVESGPTDSVLDAPTVPYTQQLLADTPRLEPARSRAQQDASITHRAHPHLSSATRSGGPNGP